MKVRCAVFFRRIGEGIGVPRERTPGRFDRNESLRSVLRAGRAGNACRAGLPGLTIQRLRGSTSGVIVSGALTSPS